MSGCFLQCWGWGEISAAFQPHNFTWHSQAAEMEPSQQLRTCHLPMGRYRPIPWDVIPGHAGRLTSSLHGGRPLVQLPSLLRLCKETSYLMAVLPCPSSAQQSSSAAEGEPCAPHPLLHTCSRAVGLHRGCQRATQRGAGVHHPPPAQQGCADPEHVDGEVVLTQVHPPEECQKNSNV